MHRENAVLMRCILRVTKIQYCNTSLHKLNFLIRLTPYLQVSQDHIFLYTLTGVIVVCNIFSAIQYIYRVSHKNCPVFDKLSFVEKCVQILLKLHTNSNKHLVFYFPNGVAHYGRQILS